MAGCCGLQRGPLSFWHDAFPDHDGLAVQAVAGSCPSFTGKLALEGGERVQPPIARALQAT